MYYANLVDTIRNTYDKCDGYELAYGVRNVMKNYDDEDYYEDEWDEDEED